MMWEISLVSLVRGERYGERSSQMSLSLLSYFLTPLSPQEDKRMVMKNEGCDCGSEDDTETEIE